jgi:hypothetical protein
VPALLLLASCGGGDGDDATPSPTPPTPTPVKTIVTPTPPAPETPYRLVYREYGATEDIIWRVLAADPQQREKLTTIGHREGYGVVASISPDGRMLAYLSLPEDARSEDSSQAEAYVIDLKVANDTKLIASGVDYASSRSGRRTGSSFHAPPGRAGDPVSRRLHHLHEGPPQPA